MRKICNLSMYFRTAPRTCIFSPSRTLQAIWENILPAITKMHGDYILNFPIMSNLHISLSILINLHETYFLLAKIHPNLLEALGEYCKIQS